MLAALRRQGSNQSQVAQALGRHRSTISRELKRNRCALDGGYRPRKAPARTHGRRSRSRRNQRFTRQDLRLIEELLRRQWSPEQVAGYLRCARRLSISHETIYRHIWRDKKVSMTQLNRHRCNAIAKRLNLISRKRLGFETPQECFNAN